MKHPLSLALTLLLATTLSAQPKQVYTITADSTKLTGCDSNELIIENHTRNVPGFLYNTGNGRTAFKRAAIKISDSSYLIGSDTLIFSPGYIFSTGLTNLSRTVSANLSTGIAGGQSVNGGINAADTLRLNSTTHATKGLIKMGNSYYDEGHDYLKITTNNTGTTVPTTAGLYLSNNTPGQSGNLNQYSPPVTWEGQAFATTPGISQPIRFRAYTGTLQGQASASGFLAFESNVNSGAFGPGFYITTLDVNGTSRVGIGTSQPVSGVEFSGIHPAFTISNATSGIAEIDFTNSQHTVLSRLQSMQITPIRAETRLTSDTGNITFLTNGQERMIVDSLGKIGLAVHAPRTAVEAKGWVMTSSGGFSVSPSAFSSGAPLNGLPNIYSNGVLATYSAGSGQGFGHDFLTNGFSRLRLVDSAAIFGAGSTFVNTSGNVTPVNVLGSFLPGSGTATYSAFSISTTITQTGGANGITRGLYIHPTIGGAADFRAIEVTIGKSIFNDKVSIGTSASPTAKLVLGAGTSAAGTAPLKLMPGTVLTSPEDGAMEYDGTDYYFTQGTTRYKLSKTLARQLTTDFGAPSVAPGSTATVTLSIPGVAAGDVVTVSANAGGANPPSIMIAAYSSSADTVTLRAYNAGSSTVTLASDTYKVRVIK